MADEVTGRDESRVVKIESRSSRLGGNEIEDTIYRKW